MKLFTFLQPKDPANVEETARLLELAGVGGVRETLGTFDVENVALKAALHDYTHMAPEEKASKEALAALSQKHSVPPHLLKDFLDTHGDTGDMIETTASEQMEDPRTRLNREMIANRDKIAKTMKDPAHTAAEADAEDRAFWRRREGKSVEVLDLKEAAGKEQPANARQANSLGRHYWMMSKRADAPEDAKQYADISRRFYDMAERMAETEVQEGEVVTGPWGHGGEHDPIEHNKEVRNKDILEIYHELVAASSKEGKTHDEYIRELTDKMIEKVMVRYGVEKIPAEHAADAALMSMLRSENPDYDYVSDEHVSEEDRSGSTLAKAKAGGFAPRSVDDMSPRGLAISKALAAIRKGVPPGEAAARYGIPLSVLQPHLKPEHTQQHDKYAAMATQREKPAAIEGPKFTKDDAEHIVRMGRDYNQRSAALKELMASGKATEQEVERIQEEMAFISGDLNEMRMRYEYATSNEMYKAAQQFMRTVKEWKQKPLSTWPTKRDKDPRHPANKGVSARPGFVGGN